MTRKPVDYSKTIIYKIVCKDLEVKDCYIGNTTNSLFLHKSSCNNGCRFKLYQILRKNGGWINWEMIEIEKYPCNDANEARAKERYWYEQLNASLNSDVPGRTIKEYYEDNKDILRENGRQYSNQYYQINKNKINQKAKEKFVCECGLMIRKSDKARHNKSKKHQKKYQ